MVQSYITDRDPDTSNAPEASAAFDVERISVDGIADDQFQGISRHHLNPSTPNLVDAVVDVERLHRWHLERRGRWRGGGGRDGGPRW